MHYRKYMLYRIVSSSALEWAPSDPLQSPALETSEPDLPLRLAPKVGPDVLRKLLPNLNYSALI